MVAAAVSFLRVRLAKKEALVGARHHPAPDLG